MESDELRAAVQDLYCKILQTANRFLTHGRRYTVQFLATENPTFAEVAALMSETADLINALSHKFDAMTHSKALDYCSLMVKMGAAIAKEDQAAMDELIAELDRKPFL